MVYGHSSECDPHSDPASKGGLRVCDEHIFCPEDGWPRRHSYHSTEQETCGNHNRDGSKFDDRNSYDAIHVQQLCSRRQNAQDFLETVEMMHCHRH